MAYVQVGSLANSLQDLSNLKKIIGAAVFESHFFVALSIISYDS